MQNKHEIALHLPNQAKFRIAKIKEGWKKLSNTEDMKEMEILHTPGGNVNWGKKCFGKPYDNREK